MQNSNRLTFFILSTVGVLLLAFSAVQVFAYEPNVLISEKIVQLTNEARVAEGLSPLFVSTPLTEAAQKKANYIARTNDFAHTSVDGTTAWSYLANQGYQYRYAGENLAVHFATEEQLVHAWLASEAHRDNILSQNFEDVGVALARGHWKGFDGYFVVQLFGQQLSDQYRY